MPTDRSTPMNEHVGLVENHMRDRYSLPLATYKRHVNQLMKQLTIPAEHRPQIRAKMVANYHNHQASKRKKLRRHRSNQPQKVSTKYH